VPPSEQNPQRVLSFTEHLEELRVRIIICGLFFIFSLLVGFIFAPRILGVLMRPLSTIPEMPANKILHLHLRPDGLLQVELPASQAGSSSTTHSLEQFARDRVMIDLADGSKPFIIGAKSTSSLSYLSPLDPFMLLMKGALLAGCIVSVPMAIFQLWLFIAPGLLPRERQIVKPVILTSLVLFPIGALFAYFLAHATLTVLMEIGRAIPSLYPNIVASEYIGFILMLMIVFGLVFEFPLVLVLLARIGIIDSSYMVKTRKWAILIIAVVSAAATPTPDPFTMAMMMLPLLVLYEISLWVIRAMERAMGVPIRSPRREKGD
jgi:sec-independent protein translocase protein TatC